MTHKTFNTYRNCDVVYSGSFTFLRDFVNKLSMSSIPALCAFVHAMTCFTELKLASC